MATESGFKPVPYTADTLPPATTIRFDVTIDQDHPLGQFTGISGLNANYDVLEHNEAGQNAYAHQLPGRLKYSTVVLTKPIDHDSGKLAEWFSTVEPWKARPKATIRAFDANISKVIATWVVKDVWPVRYTGPTFSTTTNIRGAVAYESIELAHTGFTVTVG